MNYEDMYPDETGFDGIDELGERVDYAVEEAQRKINAEAAGRPGPSSPTEAIMFGKHRLMTWWETRTVDQRSMIMSAAVGAIAAAAVVADSLRQPR
jgi:hypothetical protein